jgi:hypothetical protein
MIEALPHWVFLALLCAPPALRERRHRGLAGRLIAVRRRAPAMGPGAAVAALVSLAQA